MKVHLQNMFVVNREVAESEDVVGGELLDVHRNEDYYIEYHLFLTRVRSKTEIMLGLCVQRLMIPVTSLTVPFCLFQNRLRWNPNALRNIL